MTTQSLSGSGEGGSGTTLRAAMSRARSRPAAAAGGRGGDVVHRGQAGRHGRARDAELGVPGGEAEPALRAVVPGPRHGDQAEGGVEGLVPVRDEHGLVTLPARHPRAPVAVVRGQQLAEHAPAEPQQPGPDHLLRRLQAGIAAAHGPGGRGGEPS